MFIGGFSGEKWNEIARTVASVAPTERILVFGSRAKGNFREGSDVDLAVEGSAWSPSDAEHARDLLEERFFPWSFDVILPPSDGALAEHIQRVGFEITLEQRPG